MGTIKERVWVKSIVDRSNEQKVLNFIAEEKVATLEMIVGRFPCIRWGDLFSILGSFRRQGLVTVHQVDTVLEVRIKEQTLAAV